MLCIAIETVYVYVYVYVDMVYDYPEVFCNGTLWKYDSVQLVSRDVPISIDVNHIVKATELVGAVNNSVYRSSSNITC
jgi:hypothetical protein